MCVYSACAQACLFVDHVLMFYKYYDPTRAMLVYMGHLIVPISIKFGKAHHFVYMYAILNCFTIGDLFPLFREKACLPLNTPLAVFEVNSGLVNFL